MISSTLQNIRKHTHTQKNQNPSDQKCCSLLKSDANNIRLSCFFPFDSSLIETYEDTPDMHRQEFARRRNIFSPLPKQYLEKPEWEQFLGKKRLYVHWADISNWNFWFLCVGGGGGGRLGRQCGRLFTNLNAAELFNFRSSIVLCVCVCVCVSALMHFHFLFLFQSHFYLRHGEFFRFCVCCLVSPDCLVSQAVFRCVCVCGGVSFTGSISTFPTQRTRKWHMSAYVLPVNLEGCLEMPRQPTNLTRNVHSSSKWNCIRQEKHFGRSKIDASQEEKLDRLSERVGRPQCSVDSWCKRCKSRNLHRRELLANTSIHTAFTTFDCLGHPQCVRALLFTLADVIARSTLFWGLQQLVFSEKPVEKDRKRFFLKEKLL